MLLLATSCLQMRPQTDAFKTLRALEPDGIQLTPGLLPTPGFRQLVDESGMPVRFHDGFAWQAYRQPVFDESLCPLWTSPDWTIHPPLRTDVSLEEWLEKIVTSGAALETMYPGHLLGTGDELTLAMDAEVPLAIDVSHLFIQRCAGVLNDGTLQRLFSYHRIVEVHVSMNDGRGDQHRPITEKTFGLSWARERLRSGTTVVLEAYFHKLSEDERRRQLALLRGCE